MPLPSWIELGQPVWIRPRNTEEVVAVPNNPQAIVSYFDETVVHLYSQTSESHSQLITVPADTFADVWMPRGEALPRMLGRIPAGVVYIASEPEYVGVMPIRTDLTPYLGTPNWVRVGVRLEGRAPSDSGAMIVAVRGEVVSFRQIWDDTTTPLTLSPEIFNSSVSEIRRDFTPYEIDTPNWLVVGTNITEVRTEVTYTVLSIDPYAGILTLTPVGMNRSTRFSMTNIEDHWRPANSLLEVRPTSNRTNLTGQPVLYKPPEWLRPGLLVRTIGTPRRILWVVSVDDVRMILRAQKVLQVEPEMMVTNNWEELIYKDLSSIIEPLDQYGASVKEYQCQHCERVGVRDPEVERRSSIKIRSYRCPNSHQWAFRADCSVSEGVPISLSRFERDIDI